MLSEKFVYPLDIHLCPFHSLMEKQSRVSRDQITQFGLLSPDPWLINRLNHWTYDLSRWESYLQPAPERDGGCKAQCKWLCVVPLSYDELFETLFRGRNPKRKTSALAEIKATQIWSGAKISASFLFWRAQNLFASQGGLRFPIEFDEKWGNSIITYTRDGAKCIGFNINTIYFTTK